MALSTAKEIEELADKLTATANSMDEKIIAAAKKKRISHEDAQNAFEKSLLLRQQAGGLYIDAINKILQDVETPQNELITTIDRAKHVIETMDDIEKCLTIIALLTELTLNTIALDAKGIIASIKDIKENV
ncbi:hypothetical protein EXT60_11335 [Pectobacterium carotovorum subsp. carotovorum]|nr:hypothetical protein [Pectobacterium carotovorum]MCL6364830.1 hypothetical protein [Pectobacterium carotovorum subsp. carotovorum]